MASDIPTEGLEMPALIAGTRIQDMDGHGPDTVSPDISIGARINGSWILTVSYRNSSQDFTSEFISPFDFI